VQIPLPDVKGRTDILELYLSKIAYDPSIDCDIMARLTFGMSGADLANLVNSAMLNAIKVGRSAMTMEDFSIAKDRHLIGVERSSKSITEEDKLKVAIHETGHALTGILTEGCLPIYKATILPRGDSLGVTVTLPDHEIHNYTRKEIIAKIDMQMGGRAAEEIFFKKSDMTSSCADDLKIASEAAYQTIRAGIFEEFGIHASPSLINVQEGVEQRNLVDFAVREVLTKSYERVKALLTTNKGLVEFVSQQLLKRETLTGEEIQDLVTQYRS
jgi:ATP-dependent metalloprotease